MRPVRLVSTVALALLLAGCGDGGAPTNDPPACSTGCVAGAAGSSQGGQGGGSTSGAGGSGGVGGSASGAGGSSAGSAGSAGAQAGAGGASAGQGGSTAGGQAGAGGAAAGGEAGAGGAGAGGAGAGGAGSGGAGSGGAGQGGNAGAAGGAVTTLRVHYPAAGHKLTLRGDAGGLTWEAGKPMEAGPDDTWTVALVGVIDDVEWKPLLDDAEWARGPNYLAKVGGVVDVYPHFHVSQGEVKLFREKFTSKHLTDPRDVWVYLPPTYVENSRARFPVVYMHDGQNLFDAAMAFGGNEWKVDEAFDAAAESGEAREAVVIGVGNTAARIYEYTPSADPEYDPSGGGDKYLALLVEDLKPQVDAELRTLPEASTTAIVGSSLGGLISSYAGVKRPEVFGLVGALSPSTWWDGTFLLGQVASVAGQATKAQRVYVDSGDSGQSKDDMANTAKLAEAYKGAGYKEGVDLRYVVQQGATHSEVFWAQRFPGAMAFLLGPRPDSGSKPF